MEGWDGEAADEVPAVEDLCFVCYAWLEYCVQPWKKLAVLFCWDIHMMPLNVQSNPVFLLMPSHSYHSIPPIPLENPPELI